MATNLKPLANKKVFTGSNPMQSLQSPVNDFLAPTLPTATQAPKQIPQSTPEEQESFLRNARYESAIQDPKFSTGIKILGGVLNKIDNFTEGKVTKLVQGMDKPDPLSEFDPYNFKVGANTKDTTNEMGNYIQNKAPGIEKAKQEGRYITQDELTKKIENAIVQMPDATDEEIAQAIGELKNEGYFFEGINDKNSQTYESIRNLYPPIKLATDVIGGATKTLGQVVGGSIEGFTNIARGGADILGGETNKGTAKIASGGVELGTSILGGAFPIATSVFNTELAQPIIEPTIGNIQKGANYVVDKGLDLTGMDQNSEEYQNYSQALTTVGTILTTMGIIKGTQLGFNKTFGENITYNNAKVSDFIKNTGKTAEDLQNAVNKIRPDGNLKINENTPLSKVFTPEEFAQMQAVARNAGASGIGRREGIISDAFQAKVGEKVSQYTQKAGEKVSQYTQKTTDYLNREKAPKPQPLPKEKGNAVTSDGQAYTMENTPGTLGRVYKSIFTGGDNKDLAMRAFSPSLQGKTQNQKLEIADTMLEGARALHNEQAKGNITADVSTMQGGLEGVEQTKQLYGSIIGDVTGVQGGFSMQKEVKALENSLNQRGATISQDLNSLAKNILEDFASYGPDITIKEAQQLMSTIKSVVFSDPAKIKQLSGTISGSAIDGFLKAFETKFEQAIENASGRFPELQEARKIYKNMKQIEKSLADSYIVEARNQAKKGGLSNTVGNIGALAELARSPSLSAMASAAMIKLISTEIGKGKTRNASYEKLMENLKIEDINRAKGKIPYKESNPIKRNKFTEDMKKQGNKKVLGSSSGKATGAKNFRVNQQFENVGIKPDITSRSKIVRPTTKTILGTSPEKAILEANKRKQQIEAITDDIARGTEAARYGGSGNDRVEQAINSKLSKGEITKSEALQILENAKTNKKFSYMNQKKLDDFIDTIKGDKKIDTFDDLVNSKTPEISTMEKGMTHRQIYNKLNEMADDGRFGEKSWNTLAEEFKAKTGKDIMDVGMDDFGSDGMIKSKNPPSTTPTNTQKGTNILGTSKNSPIIKKTGTESKSVKSEGKTSEKKTIVKPKEVETNITRNEKIEKGFSDSAKTRWDKGEFTSTEKGNAIKYLKSNYKGKEYTIDGKKYTVDAIDNRNEQIRLIDSEGNIKRVRINNLPETKVTDNDIFDYYNKREQKGYKTIVKSEGKTSEKKTLGVKKETNPTKNPNQYKFSFIIDPVINKNSNQVDIQKGISFLSNTNNTQGRKIFEDATGIKLPKTKKESITKIEEYLGISSKPKLSIKEVDSSGGTKRYFVVDESGKEIGDMLTSKSKALVELKKQEKSNYGKLETKIDEARSDIATSKQANKKTLGTKTTENLTLGKKSDTMGDMDTKLMEEIKGLPDDLKLYISIEEPKTAYRVENTHPAFKFKGKSVWGKGKYFSSTEEGANTIKNIGASVDKYEFKPGTKILSIDIDKLSPQLFNKYLAEGNLMEDLAKKNGYDGLRIIEEGTNMGGDQIVIFNTEKIKLNTSPKPTSKTLGTK